MRSRLLRPAASLWLVGVLLACTSWPGARTPRTATPVTGAAQPSATLQPATRPPPATPLPPAQALRRASDLLQQGDYDAASAQLHGLADSGVSTDVARQALLLAGRAELEAGHLTAAAESLTRFVETYPQDRQVPTAWFWLGRAREGLGDGRAAAEAYRRYLDARPLLQSYVQERIADALARAGDHEGAITAYRAAADAATDSASKAAALEGLAASARALQHYDQALAVYDEILRTAQLPTYRAQILYEAGVALRDAGRPADAAARWNQLIATYPETSYAAQALPLLDREGLAEADDLLRARVQYGAGQYEAALQLMRAYLASNPASHSGDVHYYAALAYRQLGRHQDSLRELDWLINTHPQNSLVPEACYQKGESLTLLGQVDQAVAVFRQMAAAYPQHPRAAQALWRVAQVYDGAGRAAEASNAYLQAAATYPQATYAADARFRAGFVYYLTGQLPQAAQVWSTLLPQESDPEQSARLLLWLGKVAQRQGRAAEARSKWAAATAAAPDSFFGLRASDLLAGHAFVGRAPAGAFDLARYAPRGRQDEAERWLAGWAGEQSVSTLPTTLTDLPAFQRGLELWTLGESAAATAELRGVQATVQDQPWTLFALALYARGQGLYQLATTSAERLLALAPAAARQSVPRLIAELAYPTYYADLVLAQAQSTGTDPALFFALIHQESKFDRAATSRSDARGLTQVIPSTGQYIAAQLGDPAFAPEHLWRPIVSVRYGLWYLASALRMFDDDALIALVAYNAGPGNAARWAERAGGDDDVYFEIVSNAQPRAYMEKIYQYRAQYERLYR